MLLWLVPRGLRVGSQIGADADLVNMMKIWLDGLENKRMTSNKDWMHLVDGDEFEGEMLGWRVPKRTQCDVDGFGVFEC